MRTRHLQVFPEEMDQEQSRLDFSTMLMAVYLECHVDRSERFHSHATPPCARASARRSARRVSSRTIARL